jgi:uncharacterized membrane protein YjgN (DUF898 family)
MENVNTNTNVVNVNVSGLVGSTGKSKFDGGLASLVAHVILAYLITMFTFGICAPWAMCILYGWKINHTIIEGHRLKFTGKAMDLFGEWLKWLLLTIVTFGIYGFWVGIKLEQWRVKNTEFAD